MYIYPGRISKGRGGFTLAPLPPRYAVHIPRPYLTGRGGCSEFRRHYSEELRSFGDDGVERCASPPSAYQCTGVRRPSLLAQSSLLALSTLSARPPCALSRTEQNMLRMRTLQALEHDPDLYSSTASSEHVQSMPPPLGQSTVHNYTSRPNIASQHWIVASIQTCRPRIDAALLDDDR